MNDWLPIITAPKDRMIVLAWAGSHTTRGFWFKHQWVETGSGKDLVDPTHWCELPMPPNKIEKL